MPAGAVSGAGRGGLAGAARGLAGSRAAVGGRGARGAGGPAGGVGRRGSMGVAAAVLGWARAIPGVGRLLGGRGKSAAAEPAGLAEDLEAVRGVYPTAVGLEAYMKAVESTLNSKGFNPDNCIALVGICRDEACRPFQTRIEESFGLSFSQCSLGGFVTMGQVGFGAAMGHCPLDPKDGRERFVFFGFPHVGVSHDHDVGKIDRTGRPSSGACGALLGAMGQIQGAEDLAELASAPATVEEPEFSSLVSKLASQMVKENVKKEDLNVKSITDLSETVITDELEAHIAKAVEGRDCDYAVFTGTQINSSYVKDIQCGDNQYVAPGKSYCVVKGQRWDMSLNT